MLELSPLATGILEGTLLALLGVLLFQFRHRAGLIPFIFLLGGLALTIPFTTHLTQLQLEDPWTVSRAYAIVLPVFVTLVVLLHILVGSLEARIAAALPVLGGGLIAAATAASTLFPVVIPQHLLPSAGEALTTGALVALGAVASTTLFEWWHRHVAQAPPMVVFLTSSLAGVLVHGLAHDGLQMAGLVLPGGTWPAIVAVPLVAGAAPIAFVAVYAEVVIGDLAPVAEGPHAPTENLDHERDLDRYRDAEARMRKALAWVQEAVSEHERDGPRANAGFFVASPEGRVLHATDQVGWMAGYAREDVIGADIDALFGSTPNGHANGQNGRAPTPWAQPGTHRAHVQRPDGETRLLEVKIQETPRGALRGTVRDRTVAEQRREAQRHRERARSAVEILARDVPNLLAAPRTQAEHLAETVQAADTPEQINRLSRKIHDGLDDVHDALERARILSDLEDPHIETLDLNRLLRETVQDLSPARLESMEIRWRTPTRQAPARGCPLLKVAVEELLTNAQEHAGPDARVTVGLERRGDAWIVSVDDDGPGVPDELKPRIFEGFRLDNDGHNAGLGLHLARAVVQTCGGRLWVEDRHPGRPEAGASFRIEIPVAGGAEAPGSAPAPAPAPRARNGSGTRNGASPARA